MTKKYWQTWLARQRLHCTLCRFDGPHAGKASMGNPPPGENAPSLVLLPTPECNPVTSKLLFITRQRAAFRRHVRECHPAWEDRIRWSR
jgi:hypothetical protein